ncbi:MAG: cyclic nucleotide-binding/CBS domain-containing protein [Myxococcota bacterium]
MDLETQCAMDLMTRKIVRAEPHEILRVAINRMSENHVHSLLVIPDQPNRGISILTGKDCIQAICDVGTCAIDELCVEDVMTRPAVTVPAELCIRDCLQLMRLAGVRTAPVLSGSELVGVFTFTDALTAIAK